MKRFWMTLFFIGTTFNSSLAMADHWVYYADPEPREYAPPPPPPQNWGPPPMWQHPHDYHPVHSWYEGQSLPPEYCDHRYDVDWREQGLPPPPHGHHWKRVHGDYVLVAAASSLITAILLGSH
ncbi:RcnB family protein [Acinetobacter sp. MD2(2019)]|uniref:RcnB family protein n=1 Tax=Acinetobacter sp. MD2(2019) TaxID=2605273 RepID=UPI002D1F1D4F|nr:RcnB family protein [Acinetobacter sp. MD2(2019)]MEB3753445.1 RcnB family protein [Acinetobacter sp. MD2(2019)]